MYTNYLLKWSNSLEDTFKLSGWGNFSTNLYGDKQMYIQFYN